MALRTIVALLDGSPLDQVLLRQAQVLAARLGRVVLIEAVPHSSFADGAVERARAADAVRYLAKLGAQPTFAGGIDISVLYGDAAGAAVEEAFLRKADMLVMGLAAQNGFGYGTVGSVDVLAALHAYPVAPVRVPA